MHFIINYRLLFEKNLLVKCFIRAVLFSKSLKEIPDAISWIIYKNMLYYVASYSIKIFMTQSIFHCKNIYFRCSWALSFYCCLSTLSFCSLAEKTTFVWMIQQKFYSKESLLLKWSSLKIFGNALTIKTESFWGFDQWWITNQFRFISVGWLI